MRLRLFRIGIAALAAGAVAACGGSSTGPAGERFELVSINGAPLPAPFSPVVAPMVLTEATRGTLTLQPDGTAVEVTAVRCRDPLPPGWQCTVDGGGQFVRTGTFSRADGAARLDGETVALAFSPGRVVLSRTVASPQGSPVRYDFEFRR